MSEFAYKGRDSQGKVVTGHITGANSAEAAKSLLGNGITPIDLKEGKKGGNSKSEGLFSKDLLGGRVTHADIIMFSRQMAALTRAGLPIGTSIDRLAESTKSKPLKKALINIHENVAAGKSLSLSIAQHPNVFSPIFVNMIDTGEHTGKLEEAFERLTLYLELESTVKKRIKAIMRYPIIVLSAILVAMVIINIMVIPAFANMFKRFGSDLPLPTKILLSTSNLFVHYWPHMIVAVILIVAGLKYYIRSQKGSYVWDHFKLRIPLFGNVLLQVLLMRFASLFAMIFQSGVPLIKGMGLVANAIGNDYIKKAILKIRDSVEEGDTLLNATKSSKLFPPLVTQMISVGEDSGTLDTMLEQVSDYYQTEVDYNIKRLGDLMEPILLLIIAAMVLILALGVFLPLWDMATFA